MKTRILIYCTLFAALAHILAQGTFINLDFEMSTLGTNEHTVVLTGEAFPGWTVYRDGIAQSQVGHNVTIAFTGIRLQDNTLLPRPLSGNFGAYFYSDTRAPVEIALAQTGQISAGAGLLQFRTSMNDIFGPGFPESSLSITFNNTILTPQLVNQGNLYRLWTVDISAFAGTTGELRFTGLPVNQGWDLSLDDITFVPVPEPSTLALLALGGAAFAFFRGRRRNR